MGKGINKISKESIKKWNFNHGKKYKRKKKK